MRPKAWMALLLVIVIPVLACGGGTSLLPATNTPRAQDANDNAENGNGGEEIDQPGDGNGNAGTGDDNNNTGDPGTNDPEFFDIDLSPSDVEGLEARADQIFQDLVNSGGEVDRGVLLDAFAELADYERVGGEWRFTGPAPIEGLYDDSTGGEGPTAGRTNAFAIHPDNPDLVYAAMSVGGIWKTEDHGESWVSLTDDQVPLNYGGLEMDPNDPNTLYALLGEFDGQIASQYGYLANGIMRSRDAGETWELVGADEFLGASVSALDFDADGNLYAASGQRNVYAAPPDQPDYGVFRSSNGGESWERLVSCEDFASCMPDNADVTARMGGFFDLDISADGTIFTSLCGLNCYATLLLRSTDEGASWEQIDLEDAVAQWEEYNEYDMIRVGGEPGTRGFEIAVSPADPDRVLAGGGLTFDWDGEEGHWSWVIRSDDGGDTWEYLTEMDDYCALRGKSPQCTYDNVVEFHPTDPDIAYIGGATQDERGNYLRHIQRTTDFGDSWDDLVPPEDGSRIHADVHAVAMSPDNPDELWAGTDGGIFWTADAFEDPPQWEFRGVGIGTLLFVDIGVHPTDPGQIIGGLQDNSCAFTTDGENWESTTCGGDGAFTAYDPYDPEIVYGNTYPVWVFMVNEDGGVGENYDEGSWAVRTDGLDFEEYWPFRPPYIVDPSNEGRIYIHSSRVYRTDDRGESWEAISDYLAYGTYDYIQSVAVSLADPDVLYAGTTDAMVWMTSDGGEEWTDVTGEDMPQRPVRRVLVDPEDENTAYVVFSGFDVQTPDTPGHIFRTTDGGESWEDISFNLPDAPLSSIAIDVREDHAGVYVGGALGVWVLQADGEEWLPYGTGMPFALVTDIEINPETGLMAAGTWGLSVWVIEMP